PRSEMLAECAPPHQNDAVNVRALLDIRTAATRATDVITQDEDRAGMQAAKTKRMLWASRHTDMIPGKTKTNGGGIVQNANEGPAPPHTARRYWCIDRIIVMNASRCLAIVAAGPADLKYQLPCCVSTTAPSRR